MKNLSQEKTRVKSIPAWKNNNCKGCEVGKGLACSKNNKAGSMARTEQVKQRILEKKPRK